MEKFSEFERKNPGKPNFLINDKYYWFQQNTWNDWVSVCVPLSIIQHGVGMKHYRCRETLSLSTRWLMLCAIGSTVALAATFMIRVMKQSVRRRPLRSTSGDVYAILHGIRVQSGRHLFDEPAFEVP